MHKDFIAERRSFFNGKTKKGPMIKSISKIGASSRNIRLQDTFKLSKRIVVEKVYPLFKWNTIFFCDFINFL